MLDMLDVRLTLSEEGSVEGKGCSTLELLSADKFGGVDETMEAILEAGTQLWPSPEFGGEARILLVRSETAAPDLPLGYLIALGQVARRLVDIDFRQCPHHTRATVWTTYRGADPELAVRIGVKVTQAHPRPLAACSRKPRARRRKGTKQAG